MIDPINATHVANACAGGNIYSLLRDCVIAICATVVAVIFIHNMNS